MRRAAKKTVMLIYGVMYTKLYEYTLRTEAFTCIGNEFIVGFGVSALSDCTNFIILHMDIIKICKCIFGCLNFYAA